MIKSLSQKIIDAFLEHGNLTDRDLVKILKADGSSVRPRRLNLQRKGIVKDTGTKDFTKSKLGWTIYELGKNVPQVKQFYNGLKRGRKPHVKLASKDQLVNSVNKLISSLTNLSNVLSNLK
jgi:transcription initiation factor IIE alpha subunit